MGFVKTVSREFGHEIEYYICDLLLDTSFCGSIDENGALLRHLG